MVNSGSIVGSSSFIVMMNLVYTRFMVVVNVVKGKSINDNAYNYE